jgi:large subunit ribosomal protein L2
LFYADQKYKPTSPGQRFQTVQVFDEITTSEAVTSRSSSRCTARAPQQPGHLTSWWRAAVHKRMYRIIDFKRDKREIPRRSRRSNTTRTVRRESRSSPTPMARSATSCSRSVSRSAIRSSPAAVDILAGNALPLKNIPLGTHIHNVELTRQGRQIARSAGSAVQLVAKEGDYASVKMPSGEIRKIFSECYATIGQVGNLDHENVSNRKGRPQPLAGTAAARPRRRDESGRSSARRWRGQDLGRRHPVSPWGLPTKGYKTRKRKRTDSFVVQRRSK